MKIVIGTIVTLLGLIGAVYSGGLQMIDITDNLYVSKVYFRSYEARQYVRDRNSEISQANREIRLFEFKLDSGAALSTWEGRAYEEAKKRKATHETELGKFLHPAPVFGK